MVGKAWWQEPEAAVHTASAAGKQRVIVPGSLCLSSPEPQPVEKCKHIDTDLPTPVNLKLCKGLAQRFIS